MVALVLVFGCVDSSYTQQYCCADSLRVRIPCGLRQTSARRAGLLVGSPAQSRDLINEIFWGYGSFPLGFVFRSGFLPRSSVSGS